MGYGDLKSRLKAFLLAQSDCYLRAVRSQSKLPAVSKVARCLHIKHPEIPERRFEKYLSDRLTEQQLAITAIDLVHFAKMAGIPLSAFIAKYLEQGE